MTTNATSAERVANSGATLPPTLCPIKPTRFGTPELSGRARRGLAAAGLAHAFSLEDVE